MRGIIVGCVVVSLAAPLMADEAPLVEQYLHSGELARGEHVLEAALAAAPDDDQLRFSLGVLQFVRGVERLGQSLYEYGCRSENARAPFVRLPVPKNPDPSPITYFAFRRMFEEFYNDLATAEATLAAIDSDDVALTLRLADIRLDFQADGEARERLGDVLHKVMGRNFRWQADNPEFLVRFDRGDVAWLRAYCHLLMALLDAQLAVDLRPSFDLTADELFAQPKHPFEGTDAEKREKLFEIWGVLAVKEPARFGRFREHLLKVCELNHETWKHIRAERDDDREWLPNAKQKGVLGLPVSDAMIDAWLGMVNEFAALLEGKKAIPSGFVQFVSPKASKGLNVKVLLSDPPEKFHWDELRSRAPEDKYLDATIPDINLGAFFRLGQVFNNPFGVAYAVWFN